MNTSRTTKAHRDAHRKRIKEWLNEMRSVPCADCEQRFPPVCMDFDHLPGFTKEFGIMNGYANRSRARILAEIAKCEVVCSNCHRIRTSSRR